MDAGSPAGAGAGGRAGDAQGATAVGDYPVYDKALSKCKAFLREFRSYEDVPDGAGAGAGAGAGPGSPDLGLLKSHKRMRHRYLELITDVARRTHRATTRINIDLDDVVVHGDAEFAADIALNTMRYLQLFAKAIDEIVEELRASAASSARLSSSGSSSSSSWSSSSGVAAVAAASDVIDGDDVADVLMKHRVQQVLLFKQRVGEELGTGLGAGAGGAGAQDGSRNLMGGAGAAEPVDEATRLARAEQQRREADAEARKFVLSMIPPALLRRYEVRVLPRADDQKHAMALRQVKANDLGKLVTIKAIVLRATDVKPHILVAAYTCDICGYELYQQVTSKTFSPLVKCTSPACVKNQTVGKINMQTRACRFQKYQEVKVQELPEQVPVGHIPRSMTIVCRGEVTRSVQPGDVVTVGGVFLPTPYTGYQAVKAGLSADTFLEAMQFTKTKKLDSAINQDGMGIITELSKDDSVYEKLAKSIAPEIFGHEDVKKALLLQLVGGMTRKQKDGMKTRGDLHMCLMGDPGVAKSQLLKHIAKLATRCVYTTGKGSSGVGLTAAVIRDPITQELTLEGGALVLADKGICCIVRRSRAGQSSRPSSPLTGAPCPCLFALCRTSSTRWTSATARRSTRSWSSRPSRSPRPASRPRSTRARPCSPRPTRVTAATTATLTATRTSRC